MSNIVEVNRLTKAYGNIKAVDEVSFTIEEGSIYGLLGRNGAGKTTLMHMLTAQTHVTSGEMKVFGDQPFENHQVLSKVCFIKESQKYPDNYRIVDVLEVASSLFQNWDREYAYSLIEDFRLPLKRRMKKLSRGMLSSVGIVVGLASRAPLTIFDEPYTGLDVVARSLFYDRLIEDYGEHPRTIILSTHLIDEVSQVLEHVLVIDNGKLMINENADTLRGRAFTITGEASKVTAFTSDKDVIDQKRFGGLLSITCMGRISKSERDQAHKAGIELTPLSMQQLIVHLTKEKNDRKETKAL